MPGFMKTVLKKPMFNSMDENLLITGFKNQKARSTLSEVQRKFKKCKYIKQVVKFGTLFLGKKGREMFTTL